MKSTKQFKRGCLTTTVIVLLVAVGLFLYAVPVVYPALRKEVDSYQKLQNSLRHIPDICFLEELPSDATNIHYTLLLDGRDRLSKAKGYEIGWNMVLDGVDETVSLHCYTSHGILRVDEVYRDIELWYDSHGDESTVGFQLGDYAYSCQVGYVFNTLAGHEKTTFDDIVLEQAMDFARQIIDTYLDG